MLFAPAVALAQGVTQLVLSDVVESPPPRPASGGQPGAFPRQLVGELLPGAFVDEVARVVPQVQYVGWDIVVTPDGPVLVEGNWGAGVYENKPSVTGIRTGPSTPPDDPILGRLLPDFHRLDPDAPDPAEVDSANALRSLHEPELLDLKTGVAAVVLQTCPPDGGEVRLALEQAEAWLSALNDVRLALGTALDVQEDMPDELPPDDPRSPHLGVYHWLTWVQETLVEAVMN